MILALSAFLDYKNLCNILFPHQASRQSWHEESSEGPQLCTVLTSWRHGYSPNSYRYCAWNKNFNNVFITIFVRTYIYPSYVFSYHFNIDLSKKIIPFLYNIGIAFYVLKLVVGLVFTKIKKDKTEWLFSEVNNKIMSCIRMITKVLCWNIIVVNR